MVAIEIPGEKEKEAEQEIHPNLDLGAILGLKTNLATKLKNLHHMHEDERRALSPIERRDPEIVMSLMKKHHDELALVIGNHKAKKARNQRQHPDLDDDPGNLFAA